jgi:hypothetical protein
MRRMAPKPQATRRLTDAEAMRLALGPGSQFIGPTESILLTVSCPPASVDKRAETPYCQKKQFPKRR